MLRIAALGTETETSPLITSAGRMTGVECERIPLDRDPKGFDAVVCCGLQGDGVETICEQAHSGKHLLIDLAVLETIADVGAVVDACRDANVQLIIAQPSRHFPAVQTVRQSLDASELGAPGLLRIHRWTADADERFGQLLLREIDLANYLLDGLPTTVYAVARQAGGIPDLLQVHLGFNGGAMALIDITVRLPEGDDYYSLSLIGARGAAYADDHHNTQLLYRGGSAVAERTGENVAQWTELLQQYARAIEDSSLEAIGVDSALAALRVTTAVGRAIELGTAMHWQGEEYEPV